MLAYLFWHRPRPDVDREAYEAAQRSFHAALEVRSASFQAQLPFDGRPGYEDWYLVEDWAALGELNLAAVDEARRASHDRAASLIGEGWGGLYELARGPAAIPDGVGWHDKPRDVDSEAFMMRLPDTTIWRRLLVLGPAAEFCLAGPGSPGRWPVWPEPPSV
jgi:hypothetical protein